MLNELLPVLVTLLLVGLIMALIMKRIGQPYLIGYILAGILIGEQGLGLVTNRASIETAGSLGVLFLLFFIGIDTPIERMQSGMKQAGLGLVIQVILSVAIVSVIGFFLQWPIARTLLLGFVITMSSSVVIMGMIERLNLKDKRLYQQTLMISILQDLAVVPMMIILNLCASGGADLTVIFKQIVGGILVFIVFKWILSKRASETRILNFIGSDKEIRLIVALLICLSFALISAQFELSTALGAFVGGVIVANLKGTEQSAQAIEPFRILFLALFFISIGMLIDLNFMRENIVMIFGLVLIAFILNTGINAFVLKSLNNNWTDSFKGSAYLSQIGEFSFVLALVGYNSGIITEYGYQTTIAVVATSLAVSPVWITIVVWCADKFKKNRRKIFKDTITLSL